MPSTGWNTGPFALTADGITNAVTKNSPGAYALGRKNSQGVFVISYVGRSDVDLAGRLRNWVGKYDCFKGGYYNTPYDAFVKECRLYHDFSPPDNSIHPDRGTNKDWSCPACNIFD